MLPSIGFPELLVVVLLAILVVGPEDLPKMMRKLSGYLRQIRAMGDEFKSAFNDMAKDTELDELRKEIDELKSLGKLGDLSDSGFEKEMRRLDSDIRDDVRDGTSKPHPKASTKSGGDNG